MSDHEGGDIGDWEDASLPAGLISSFRGTESISAEVLPRTQLHPSDQETRFSAREPFRNDKRKPQTISGPHQDRPRAEYRAEIQAINGIVHRSSGIQGRRRVLPPKPAPLTGESHASWAKKEAPSSHCETSVVWRVLMSNIRFDDWATPDEAARQQLDDICRNTGAYIATPAYDTNKFYLWGTKEQTDGAEKAVDAWVNHIRATGVRPGRPRWHKEKAFDGRHASRIDQREREKEMAAALRHMEVDHDYDYVLHYQWPDEPKMPEFVAKYNMSVLEEIRNRVLCKIEFEEGTIPHYRVSAQTEEAVKAISNRINNLMMEMIAQKGDFIRCSRFKLPRAPMYRNRVGWDNDPSTGLYLPTLHGEGLPEDEVEDWRKLCASEDAKNRSILRQSISTCLTSLYATTKHVRMRVTFAELGFAQLQMPPPERDYHTFNEFCQMIPHQNVRINPLGLRSSRGNLADLADFFARSDEFGPGETYYTLHFDFDSRKDSTLRFEIEFCIGIMTGELETIASRWLEFAHNSEEYEMLEVNMLDLEHLKCNYQIHIGATNLFEPENGKSGAGKHMISFKDGISFSPPPAGIKAPPRRRAVYPLGNGDLRRVEEITCVRYPFKDTHGVFELQRKDIYDERSSVKSLVPMSSVWAGKHYYPEWDSLMGEFANAQPGEQVSWSRDLGTFFLNKKAVGEDSFRALPRGFRTWLKEIEEIQALLTEGIETIEAQALSMH